MVDFKGGYGGAPIDVHKEFEIYKALMTPDLKKPGKDGAGKKLKITYYGGLAIDHRTQESVSPDGTRKPLTEKELIEMRRREKLAGAGSEFDEAEHPRAEDGKFTFKGEGVTKAPGTGTGSAPAAPKSPAPKAPEIHDPDNPDEVQAYDIHFKKYVRDMIDGGYGDDLKKMPSLKRSHAVSVATKDGETDQKILGFFSDDPDWSIREDVAVDANMETLHKMEHDSNYAVRAKVVRRIDQAGLHEMMNDQNAEIRTVVATRIDQAGLHEMMNDPRVEVYEVVADRIDQKGLNEMVDRAKTIKGDIHKLQFEELKSWMGETKLELSPITDGRASDLEMKMLKRQTNMNLIADTIESYDKTGTFKFSDGMKTKIRDITASGGESRDFVGMTDEFYKVAADGKYDAFHIQSKDDWERTSSSKLALALKDSVKRQYGTGEIVYHDSVKDYEYELNRIYEKYPRDVVDGYVKTQKEMTTALLDEMYPATKDIPIYRGTTKNEIDMTGYNPEENVNEWLIENKNLHIKSNPVSSWSLKPEVAQNFAKRQGGVILSTKVSKNDIWSTFMSHAYGGNEREILLIGKDRVVNVDLPEYNT